MIILFDMEDVIPDAFPLMGLPIVKKNIIGEDDVTKKSSIITSGSIAYPIKLGLQQKNILNSNGDIVHMGRWINTNQMDWQKPKWSLVTQCWGWVIDRAVGGKKYSLFESDAAIMTLYFDPVEEMPIYDMLPLKSPLFDMGKQPTGSLEDLYGFATVEGIGDIHLQDIRPIAPIPLLGSIVAALLLIPTVLAKDK